MNSTCSNFLDGKLYSCSAKLLIHIHVNKYNFKIHEQNFMQRYVMSSSEPLTVPIHRVSIGF